MREPPKSSPKVKSQLDHLPSSKTEKTNLSGVQLTILAGLALAVFCVLGVLTVSVIVNRDLLLGRLSPEQSTAQSTVSPTPRPSATPTVIPTPSATPPPRSPISTATMVVSPDFINREKINEITSYVVNIRGLEPLEDVPSLFLTRTQLRQHLETTYAQTLVSSTLGRDRELYVAMGLLDRDADFRSLSLDSAVQNIAGFYSPDEQVLYLVSESVNMFASEEIVYAHEYTHALQDQHFGLARFLSDDVNEDQAIAALALIEGDSTLVMGTYQFNEITASELEYMAYQASLIKREVVDAVSPSLGALTFFPYLQGSRFVYTLWVDAGFRWDRVNAAYDDPPISSEQVIHPEKYLVRDDPQAVTLPDLGPSLGDGWREIDRDVLGEIGLLAWLLDRLDWDVAAQAAAGWDGDMYALWLDAHSSQVLVVKSIWDAPGEAAQFSEAFADYLTLQASGVPKLTLNEPGRRVWEYEGRATFLGRAGNQVLIILSPGRAVLDRVRGEFPEF
jgi:hypothetical protein